MDRREARIINENLREAWAKIHLAIDCLARANLAAYDNGINQGLNALTRELRSVRDRIDTFLVEADDPECSCPTADAAGVGSSQPCPVCAEMQDDEIPFN